MVTLPLSASKVRVAASPGSGSEPEEPQEVTGTRAAITAPASLQGVRACMVVLFLRGVCTGGRRPADMVRRRVRLALLKSRAYRWEDILCRSRDTSGTIRSTARSTGTASALPT